VKLWTRSLALGELNQVIDLLQDIRARHIEIDIEETNKTAWLDFLEHEKSFGTMIEQKSAANGKKRNRRKLSRPRSS
jgi:hypothetical protein